MITAIEVKHTNISELPVMETVQSGTVIHAEKNGMDYQMQAELLLGLPAVTTDDNGKVLTVVDGTWTVGDVVSAVLPVAEEGVF